MATVARRFYEAILATGSYNAGLKDLGIPPDTENTPHAIAAAVLGIDEDDLRRALMWSDEAQT